CARSTTNGRCRFRHRVAGHARKISGRYQPDPPPPPPPPPDEPPPRLPPLKPEPEREPGAIEAEATVCDSPDPSRLTRSVGLRWLLARYQLDTAAVAPAAASTPANFLAQAFSTS